MISKRIMFIFILSIVAICSISCISAEDLNSTHDLATNDNVEITQNTDLLSAEDNTQTTDILEESNETEVNAKITPITLSGGYKTGKATIRLTDINTNAPLTNKSIQLALGTNIRAGFIRSTDDNGIATFNFKDFYYLNESIALNKLSVGEWPIDIYADSKQGIVADHVYANLTVYQTAADIKATDLNVEYPSSKNLTIYLTDSSTGSPIADEVLKMYMTHTTYGTYYLTTDENGRCEVDIKKLTPGTYDVTLSLNSTQNIKAATAFAKITISNVKANIKASKLTATYDSGKVFKIKVTDKNGVVSGLKLKLKVYTGSKYKTVYLTTNSNGIASYKTSGLSKGTHKVVISNMNSTFSAKSITSSIVIKPKKLYIYGEDYKFKQGGGLILGTFDKQKDKLVKGVKLQIKIYKTAKKYKTFNLVTGYDKQTGKDVIVIETNKFSIGSHKVKVKITSPNYKGSASGTITIPKSSKNYEKFTYILSNGKEKFL